MPLAAEILHDEGKVRRVLVVDLDAHQGNGTAAVFQMWDWAFILDLYERDIFPSRKEPEDYPLSVSSGLTGGEYLGIVTDSLPRALDAVQPDLVIYNAGSDPFVGDPLAGFRLSKTGHHRARPSGGRCRAEAANPAGDGPLGRVLCRVVVHSRRLHRRSLDEIRRRYLTPHRSSSSHRGTERLMNVHDYLLDHAGYDWGHLLRPWGSLLPPEFTLWLMNRYGDLFLILPDGSVQMLDLGDGSLTKLAESREDFIRKIDEDDNADDWLMVPLVDRLVAAGMLLESGQCYSYVTPPILGGDYTVENTMVLPIPEHFGLYGSYHEQLEGVPDGTKVVIKVQKPPASHSHVGCSGSNGSDENESFGAKHDDAAAYKRT